MVYHVLLYYGYTPIDEPEQFAKHHAEFCKSLKLKGRIIVAPEGLNGTVSGTPESCDTYIKEVKKDPRFTEIEFKTDVVTKPAFEKLFVRVKPEIVHSGLRDPSVINPQKKTGIHLNGEDFLKLKDQDNVVVLDVRSDYEHGVGKFKNAITLDIHNFREFPSKIQELEHLKDKKVITYCTGGIKCEKATALLLEKGFKEVYQLHGGIIQYAKDTGGKDFDGVCYVFDNRLVVPVNSVNPSEVSHCRHCGNSSHRMINCANALCNAHFVQCETCSTDLEGCCSEACQQSPAKRAYNGTGYYVKQIQ